MFLTDLVQEFECPSREVYGDLHDRHMVVHVPGVILAVLVLAVTVQNETSSPEPGTLEHQQKRAGQ